MSLRISMLVSCYMRPLLYSVTYFILDMAASGDRFSLYGSPSLAHVLRQAAIDIPHPNDANRTLWDAREDTGPFTGPIDKDALEVQQEVEAVKSISGTGVAPLGSGSDYTVFLQRLGVRSMGFNSVGADPILSFRLQAPMSRSLVHLRVLSTIIIQSGIRTLG